MEASECWCGSCKQAWLHHRFYSMKCMHKAKHRQQADKLTTPQPWHRQHPDTYQCSLRAFTPCAKRKKTVGRLDWSERVFTLGSFGQLSLIWDLQVTLCPHGCLLSGPGLWSETVGSFSLWLAGPATSHAQSIIAHSIMYQSLQTPRPTPTPSPQTPSSTNNQTPHLRSHLTKVKPLKLVNN